MDENLDSFFSERTPPEAEKQAQPSAPPQDLSEIPESLYVVEGLEILSEPESMESPEIVPISVPELHGQFLTPAQEITPLHVDLGGGQQENFDEQSIQAGDSLGDLFAHEPAAVAEGQVENEEELETASGFPRFYLWGSIAAAVLIVVSGVGIYLKKSRMAEAPMVAKAPEKPTEKPTSAKPEPVAKTETPIPVTSSPVEPAPKQSMESDPVAIAPPVEPAVTETKAPEFSQPIAETAHEAAPAPPAEETPAEGEAWVKKRGDALLQLKNGNLFAGRVMKFNEEGLYLRMTEGEIYFQRADVARVLPAGSKLQKGDYTEYPGGYVDLSNGNRLWGRIVDKGKDAVTLVVGSAKIVISSEVVSRVKIGLGYEVRPPER